MSADRLEGVMRLTPALGQQKLYVLVFTTEKDLQQTTQLLDPAKAYAKGVGNSVPDIPDPIARHITDGLLKLKVKTKLQLQRVGRTTIWFFRSSSGYGRQHGGTSCGCTRSGTGEEKRADAQRHGKFILIPRSKTLSRKVMLIRR